MAILEQGFMALYPKIRMQKSLQASWAVGSFRQKIIEVEKPREKLIHDPNVQQNDMHQGLSDFDTRNSCKDVVRCLLVVRHRNIHMSLTGRADAYHF